MAFAAANLTNPIRINPPSSVIAPRSCSVGRLSLPKKDAELSSASANAVAIEASAVPQCLPLAAAAAASSDLAGGVWRDVQGRNDWEGLVDPLHPLLRREIVRYGKFVAACYAAFDLNPDSPRYLNCKYGKRTMLDRSGLPGTGYAVTKYIYATPEVASATGRWIGYVAVSSDAETRRIGRRDIVVAFRGTVTRAEWIVNLMGSLTHARLYPHNPQPDVKVEAGFLSLYTSHETGVAKNNPFGLSSCREQLLSEISRLLNEFESDDEVSITMAGHSMGSSLGLLLAYDIAELGLNRRRRGQGEAAPLTVLSFAGPRVWNGGFKRRCEELGVRVLRVVNKSDPFTKMPGLVFNERWAGGKHEFLPCYAHVGVELLLDFPEAPAPAPATTTTKNLKSWWCVHDIETYIHLLLHDSPPPPQLQNSSSNNVGLLLGRAREMLVNAQEMGASAMVNSKLLNDFQLLVSQSVGYGVGRPPLCKGERAG